MYYILALYENLMIVGGANAGKDVEVINLKGKSCSKPANFLVDWASMGTYFNGFPFICGGSGPRTSECYQYHLQVHLLKSILIIMTIT